MQGGVAVAVLRDPAQLRGARRTAASLAAVSGDQIVAQPRRGVEEDL